METQTSPRRRSKTRKDLQATIAQMDALFPALADKPTKQADILCEKASAIKALISLEAEERETEQEIRIRELEHQNQADIRRIAELEQQNAALQTRPLPEAVKVFDPEHAAVRQENAVLTGLVKGIAESLGTEHERAKLAIRVIQSCPRTAAETFVPLLGFSYIEYARMLLNYKTEQQLNQVISAAQCEGPAVVFAKAVLALRDCKTKPVRPDEKRFAPDNRSAEEKLREAKEFARQPWTSLVSNRTSVAPLEQAQRENYRDEIDRRIFSGITSQPTQGDDLFN